MIGQSMMSGLYLSKLPCFQFFFMNRLSPGKISSQKKTKEAGQCQTVRRLGLDGLVWNQMVAHQ